jgi:hypothetical protein
MGIAITFVRGTLPKSCYPHPLVFNRTVCEQRADPSDTGLHSLTETARQGVGMKVHDLREMSSSTSWTPPTPTTAPCFSSGPRNTAANRS